MPRLRFCCILHGIGAAPLRQSVEATSPDTHNMGSFLPQFRAFGTAGLCTFALFAIAAWIPNDAIDLVAWLIAMFLVGYLLIRYVHWGYDITPLAKKATGGKAA